MKNLKSNYLSLYSIMLNKKIIIAVDGYASCGKSTLAKDLAKKLNYLYIDSGAMYRAVTLYLLQNEIALENHAAVIAALPSIHIEFKREEEEGKVFTLLNGKNVEDLIRSPYVSQSVSEVSTIKEVRDFLVEQQQRLGKNRGIIMDGRDIGTVVFKDAEFKIFVTSDLEIRIQRRYDEMIRKGISITREEVKSNLEHRDFIDTHREESPLYKADDAILFDNSILTREDQVRLNLNMALKIIERVNNDVDKPVLDS